MKSLFLAAADLETFLIEQLEPLCQVKEAPEIMDRLRRLHSLK